MSYIYEQWQSLRYGIEPPQFFPRNVLIKKIDMNGLDIERIKHMTPTGEMAQDAYDDVVIDEFNQLMLDLD